MFYTLRMRVSWIDEQLSKRGLPRRALADAVPGLTESKLSLVFKGERKLSADEADAIRKFFGYHLPDEPKDVLSQKIEDSLAQLGEHQRQNVVLYLEALLGEAPERQQAS